MTVVARVARCAISRLRLVKGEKYASRARPACGFAYKRPLPVAITLSRLRDFVGAACLSPLLETVSGHGENYLELPQRGELRAVLKPAFDLAFYEERPAGPSEQRAVAVKLLARRQA